LARAVEGKLEPPADFTAAFSHERAISKELGGRTVFDDREARRKRKGPAQFPLFPDTSRAVISSSVILPPQS
jgi:hypothetical protein